MTSRADGRIGVGDLARRVGVTAKALRHYDRIGLLRPDLVDDAGYRWYSPDQVDDARHIAVLRSVDVPLDDVRAYLADRGSLAAVLATQRRRLDARLERVRGQRHILDHLHTDGLEFPMPETDPKTAAGDERRIAVASFNSTWELMGKEDRTVAEDDEMLHMAHASRHHWARVPEHTPTHLGRGEWQCSRVYAVLGRSEPALHHAQRCLDICTEHGIADFDLAFAYEALARGHAVAGDAEQARAFTEQALAAAEDIAEDEDRELVLSDLESIPGRRGSGDGVITVGVDLAADPRKTALARVDWDGGRATVSTLTVGVDDDLIVEHAHGAAMIGIDSPLGWPTEFIDFVSAHRDGHDLGVDHTQAGWRSPLVNRRTDLACADYTKQQLGKAIRPLSVSADLLGHVAMRCAALQVQLLAQGFAIDRSGMSGCVVEVYPAASLALWKIALRSYKGPLGRDERERGLHELRAEAPWLRLSDEQADLCIRVDHAFDAVVCALGTAAVVAGAATVPPPEDLARYRTEGWVRLPTIQLAELAQSVVAARMNP